MDTLMKADIFFFVTTIAVILLLVLLVIICIYFIKILKNFKDISDILKQSTEKVSGHIEDFSDMMMNNPLFRLFFGKKKKTRKKQ